VGQDHLGPQRRPHLCQLRGIVIKILVAGDTHGDPQHTIYLYEQALLNECDGIFQVGDYGYWEHLEGGAAYLDMCSEVGAANDLDLWWICGNHENHTMLRALYGPGGSRYKPTPEGFWEIRPHVYYVPRGTRWNWDGVELMGLGGAYSIDKAHRLKKEAEERAYVNRHDMKGFTVSKKWREIGLAHKTWGHTRWWPEEEISDEDLNYALRDQRPLDILFTHDKPRASDPGKTFDLIKECLPNQDKIQTVIRSLTPSLVVHGHLHHHYADTIRSSDTTETTVIGLECNPDDPKKNRDPKDSWIVLDVVK
jgi:hypothetical protein